MSTAILIVEDEQSIIRIWTDFLSPLDGEIRIAMTLESAIEQMSKIPHPDIVLLDLRLPDSESAGRTLEYINALKQINPKAIVVVITGHVDAALPALASKLGADGYANKLECATQASLLGLISGALEKRQSSPKAPAFEGSLEMLKTLHAVTTPSQVA